MAVCKIIKISEMLCNYDIHQAEIIYHDILTFVIFALVVLENPQWNRSVPVFRFLIKDMWNNKKKSLHDNHKHLAVLTCWITWYVYRNTALNPMSLQLEGKQCHCPILDCRKRLLISELLMHRSTHAQLLSLKTFKFFKRKWVSIWSDSIL